MRTVAARARNSAPSSSASSPRSIVSVVDRQPAGVEPREVEQVGRELRQAVDLLAHLREELVARRLVEPRVVEQLEEAAEREERRAQLVRGVGDELAAGAVEVREAQAHALERAGELAELVRAVIDDRLVEAPGGDPVGGELEAADPPREERSRPRSRAGPRRPSPIAPAMKTRRRTTETTCSWSCSDAESSTTEPPERVGDLGVGLAAARDGAARERQPLDRVEGDGVVLDVARVRLGGRVRDRLEQRRRRVLQVEDDDPRVHLRRPGFA